VQDLMMYVWEKRELLVEDLSLKSFLFTSVRNRALNSITRSHIIPVRYMKNIRANS